MSNNIYTLMVFRPNSSSPLPLDFYKMHLKNSVNCGGISMLQNNTRRLFLCCCLIVASTLFVTLPAFATTSIKYGWIALDASKKPVLQGSQYTLSAAVKPIAYVTNGVTTKSVNAKSVIYLNNTKVGRAQALVLGDNIVGCKDAFITTFKIVNKTASTTTKNNSKTSNSTANKTQSKTSANKTTIKLSAKKMMIDNAHFNRVTLKATLSGKGYSSKDIKWTINFNKPYTKAASFKSKKYLAKTTGSKVTIWGLKWSGDDPIKVTAKLPNGKSATCKLKVISNSADNDTHMAPTKWQGNLFYLTKPGKGANVEDQSSKATKSWGNDYVAAYISNAEWLINHVDKYKNDYKSRQLRVWKQRDLKIEWENGRTVVSGAMHYSKPDDPGSFPINLARFCNSWYVPKKKGHLSATDYLYLFTGKNQWEYLLKRDKKGKWSVVNSKRASAGWNRHGSRDPKTGVVTNGFSPQGYLRSLSVTYFGVMSQIQACPNSSSHLYGNRGVLHAEMNSYKSQGSPCSFGCTHLGTYSDRIYYNVLKIAGLGTRAIVF